MFLYGVIRSLVKRLCEPQIVCVTYQMGFGAGGDAMFKRSIALISRGIVNNDDPGICWQRVELAAKSLNFRVESDRNDCECAGYGS